MLDCCMKKLFLVIILLSSSGLLNGCSADETDAQYLANAQEYFDAGKMKAASIELKNLLRDNPDNPQARLLMGQLHFETGNMASAEKELTRARELGVEDELILPLLARALLLQGKGDEVLKLPLKNLSNSGQVEVLAAQGQVKMAQGELTEAASLIEKALSKDPASLNALIAGAEIHVAKNEIDLAREKLEAASLIDQKSGSAWRLLGTIEWREKNLDLAEKAYSKAIEYNVNNFSDHFKRALVRIQLNKYDEAQQDVDTIKKSFPQHAGANYVQGLIYYHNKNFREAIISFEVALSDESHFPMALFYLGASYFIQNNLEQAETYASRFVYAAPENIKGKRLLSIIKFKKKKYSEAAELIRPVVDAMPNDIGALNLLSSTLVKMGKIDETIELLSRLAALQPDSPEAKTRLGLGLLAGGQQDTGVEQLESALQLKPDYQQASVLLVLNHIKKKDYDEALKAANTFRERNPKRATPYNMLGLVYLATKQVKEAQNAFIKAAENEPGNPYANKNLAILAIKDKDFDKARGYYLSVLKYHETHLPTLMNLAFVEELAKDEKSMTGWLQQAMKAHPKAIAPRIALARYYLSKGRPDKVSFLVNELDEIQKSKPLVLKVIAMSQMAKNEYPEAKLTLETLTAQQPDAAEAHFLLARAYTGLNDQKNAKAALQKTVELAPDSIPARLMLARVFLLDRNSAGAQEQLEALKKLAPDSTDVLLIEAFIAKLDAKPQEVLRLTEKAFEKSPTTSGMLILANLKKEMGDREGAQQLQERWVQKYPDDIRAHLALASFYATNQQVKMAIEQYSRVLDINGNNLIALNNIAWYLRDTNPQQALDYAQRANQIKPDSAALLDTLAVVLLKNGETQKAQISIARALVKAPDNPAMRYHSAMIDASAGDRTSAIKTLKALLEEGKEFPEKEEAIKLLAQLEP